MRILQINKFFYHRGGTETVFFDTIKLLAGRGHEVSEFAMTKPENLPSDFASYFAPELPELSEAQDLFASGRIFHHLFRSREVESKLSALILATNPQVAHLHNVYHHLSASTFRILKKYQIPIVMTVHDVQPMCPNHRMIRGTDDTLCERCVNNNFYQCFLNKCVNKSRKASLAAALEAYYYSLKKIWSFVDIFVCPSQFMADKMMAYGFSRDKIKVIRNPYELPPIVPPMGDKIVYIGRIHTEKGIRVLVRALPHLREYKTIIVGNGPDDEWVETNIRQRSLTEVQRVNWARGMDLEQLLIQAKVVVVPSVFYENCSLTILQALANGRLVVASNRGGNPELVVNGQTGILTVPENPTALAEGIREAMQMADLEAGLIIKQGRELVQTNHAPADYVKKLEAVYKEVLR
ncbi:MAG: glycosyltransferase [bacterium]|nr:glycosyltransferase [bacterium]